jgi:hypothetical protein
VREGKREGRGEKREKAKTLENRRKARKER